MNSIRKQVTCYKYGVRGIWLAFRYKRAIDYHLSATAVGLLLNYLLQISGTDWLLTVMLNTGCDGGHR